jgi:hypothetical protein
MNRGNRTPNPRRGIVCAVLQGEALLEGTVLGIRRLHAWMAGPAGGVHLTRCAVAIWSIIVVLGVARAALYHHPRHTGCYTVYESAGTSWRRGESLYGPRDAVDEWRYSPLLAAAAAPISLLPAPVGSAIIRAVSAAVFIAGLLVWTLWAIPDSLTRGERALLFLLAAPLSFHALGDVQTNGMVAGLMLSGMTALACDRRWTGSWLIMLAAMVKVYPIALAMLVGITRPRKPVVPLAAALLFWTALPFLSQNTEYVAQQYAEWVTVGLRYYHTAAHARFFPDIRAMLVYFGVPMSGGRHLAIIAAAAVLVAMESVITRRRRVEERARLALLFGLASCWMTVFGPGTETQTYILAAPTVAWMGVRTLRDGFSGTWLATLAVWLAFTVTQLALWFPGGTVLQRVPVQQAATLLLMGLLVAEGRRVTRRAGHEASAAGAAPAPALGNGSDHPVPAASGDERGVVPDAESGGLSPQAEGILQRMQDSGGMLVVAAAHGQLPSIRIDHSDYPWDDEADFAAALLALDELVQRGIIEKAGGSPISEVFKLARDHRQRARNGG